MPYNHRAYAKLLEDLYADKIQNLILTTNFYLSNDDIVGLVNALLHNTSLKSLILDDLDLCDRWLEELVRALQKHTSLIELSLQSNIITHNGAFSLSLLLNSNLVLELLNLNDNKINDLGILYLVMAMKKNNKLKELKLAGNKINHIGIVNLKAMLGLNKTLTTLDLSKVALGNNGVKKLVGGLKDNYTLTKLILHDNFITSTGATFLATLLDQNTLVELDLKGNKIPNSGQATLVMALKKNHTLKKLHVGTTSRVPFDKNLLIEALHESLLENLTLITFGICPFEFQRQQLLAIVENANSHRKKLTYAWNVFQRGVGLGGTMAKDRTGQKMDRQELELGFLFKGLSLFLLPPIKESRIIPPLPAAIISNNIAPFLERPSSPIQLNID